MKRLLTACFCLSAFLAVVHCQSSLSAQSTPKKKAAKKNGVKKTAAKMEAVSKEDVQTMMSGIWTIETSPSVEAADLPGEFLPPGTRVQLNIEGPTRLALEEGRRDELGGEFVLLPPFLPGICATPFGEGNAYGSHVCEKGQIIDPKSPVSNDAEFSFERWEEKPDPEQTDNQFFIEQGAKRGAHFVIIYFRYKSASWRLWIRDPDTLIGYYFVTLPSKETELIVQFWRRASPYKGVLSAQTAAQKRELPGNRYPYTMLNGVWRIATTEPTKEVSYIADEYLPPDTRLQLEIDTPNSLAIEEGRDNKREGSITLLPPYNQDICKTVFSQDAIHSPTACRDGEIIDPNEPVSFNTDFVFERWNRPANTKGSKKIFYLVKGIRPGAQLVYIDPLYKGATWKLWIRDRDTMIGECFVKYQSQEPDILIQIWRRVKTP
jgi:hypothetical protein